MNIPNFSSHGNKETQKLKRKTLVLDLDETLIFSSTAPLVHYDFEIEVLIGGVSRIFYVVKRPYLNLFLERVSRLYDLVLFTASCQDYANKVLKAIDDTRVVGKIYSREKCTFKGTRCVKDVSKIGSLSSTFIIDDKKECFENNPKNGIHVHPFYGSKNDDTLLALIPFLTALNEVKDVRSILGFRLN